MIADVLVGLVALIHLYIVYLEMVLWNTPRGHKAFKLTPEFASASKVLAANQGLYKGFLAAGLIWGRFPDQGVFPALRRHRRPLRRDYGRQENPLHPDRTGSAGADRARVELVVKI